MKENKVTKEQLYGASVEEMIERWDNNESIWSVDMGGMGPGYEQALQIAALEILRHLIAAKYDAEEWTDKSKAERDRDLIEKAVTPTVSYLRLSGAQWGAAMNIASVFYMHGPTKALEMADEDRRIQVSKTFPKAVNA